jgi:hypothetical protein
MSALSTPVADATAGGVGDGVGVVVVVGVGVAVVVVVVVVGGGVVGVGSGNAVTVKETAARATPDLLTTAIEIAWSPGATVKLAGLVHALAADWSRLHTVDEAAVDDHATDATVFVLDAGGAEVIEIVGRRPPACDDATESIRFATRVPVRASRITIRWWRTRLRLARRTAARSGRRRRVAMRCLSTTTTIACAAFPA